MKYYPPLYTRAVLIFQDPTASFSLLLAGRSSQESGLELVGAGGSRDDELFPISLISVANKSAKEESTLTVLFRKKQSVSS